LRPPRCGHRHVSRAAIGWIYLFVSPLFLNRALPAEKKNPFVPKA
jgi:hypothetical protein